MRNRQETHKESTRIVPFNVRRPVGYVITIDLAENEIFTQTHIKLRTLPDFRGSVMLSDDKKAASCRNLPLSSYSLPVVIMKSDGQGTTGTAVTTVNHSIFLGFIVHLAASSGRMKRGFYCFSQNFGQLIFQIQAILIVV